ncbi:MAG TPA: hypothetical protein VEC35_18405 [Noviherbaspirillum sp.]|nr:hypothetical protein [Noviherbaspirillum sp.]
MLFYLSHADETDAGLGFNQNYSLPASSGNDQWFAAPGATCKCIQAYAPNVLVISLGVDTYVGDPISKFRLDVPEYLRLGAQLAGLGLPTLLSGVTGSQESTCTTVYQIYLI